MLRKQWTIGGPACPIRMVFRRSDEHSFVTLKIYAAENFKGDDFHQLAHGNQIFPISVTSTIAFTEEQAAMMIEIFSNHRVGILKQSTIQESIDAATKKKAPDVNSSGAKTKRWCVHGRIKHHCTLCST